MRNKNICTLAGIFVLCFISFFSVSEGAAQGKNEKQTMRSYMESKGLYYGESNHCMYTYTNGGREIKIIGFQSGKKNIRIPEEIDGKKVTALDLIFRMDIPESTALTNVNEITISKNIDSLTANFVRYQWALRSLKQYRVLSGNRKFIAKDGILFSKDKKVLYSCPRDKKLGTYRIPAGTKKINQDAFTGCHKIKKIIMPKTVETVEKNAFNSTKINRVSLSANLKHIGESAFSGSEITEVKIPSKVKTIPQYCFASCTKLKKVTIQNGVKKVYANAFMDCTKLKEITVPPSVKKISINQTDFSSYGEKKNFHIKIYAKKNSYAYKQAKKWKKYGIKVIVDD